ncbi:hypothetical protein NA57DRAFT_70592 [Rhizodiscina lignyota]|uniref:Uncharacterized protein n=1 Tax=Rhizodiscina lignyota TaxID=1504668 RepID=A0A9P4IS45_9PEZI|nr:hypothetical protein NA57DRAFT_70592 [Rhizodiscina lignyota]
METDGSMKELSMKKLRNLLEKLCSDSLDRNKKEQLIKAIMLIRADASTLLQALKWLDDDIRVLNLWNAFLVEKQRATDALESEPSIQREIPMSEFHWALIDREISRLWGNQSAVDRMLRYRLYEDWPVNGEDDKLKLTIKKALIAKVRERQQVVRDLDVLSRDQILDDLEGTVLDGVHFRSPGSRDHGTGWTCSPDLSEAET